MQVRNYSIFVCGLLAVFAVISVGCNSRTVQKTDLVGGIIKYDGAPLAGANVAFSPAVAGAGTPSFGITNEKGEYKLQTLLGKADAGTTPGEYVVTVSKTEEIPSGKKEKDGDGNMVDIMVAKSLINPMYGDPGKTPLRATVKSGKNTVDFELTTAGK